ncbi:hypothetical protein SAMN05443377_11811 [Propionibacterium cyclohexanicum]|uniref:Capsular polysaccharide biosynthesis protein n=1 Tax=Propionibacterium cyclohexanicum TaxID=64702 RepID=A0A1H9T2J2_9ACTN|nr:hypothetical protein [Propionibacterium cyclohexanicum]SER91336.1 hypothetical protein SAMN05443377_11811 [Propionibacterium cyclohexanicum]
MDIGVLFARLRRRWYVLVVGVLVGAGLAALTWASFPLTYERRSSQVLLPGPGTVPADNNPYFYLGGLAQAADVIVLAVGSDNVRRGIAAEFPAASFEVSRDPTTAGPVILITVDARSDEVASRVLQRLLDTTAVELKRLQEADEVAPENQITVTVISQDQQGVVKRRNQMVATAGVGGLTMLMALIAAALVDGLSRRRTDESEDSSAHEPPDRT